MLYGIDKSIEYACNIIIYYTIISLIGGIPLILLFKLFSHFIEKLTLNKQRRKLIEIIAYPLGTFCYIIILSFIFKINDFEKIYFIETIYIVSPAVFSTFISVLVNQYQHKKKRENEINNLTS